MRSRPRATATHTEGHAVRKTEFRSYQTYCITQVLKIVHSRATYRHAFALSAENMTADMTLGGV